MGPELRGEKIPRLVRGEPPLLRKGEGGAPFRVRKYSGIITQAGSLRLPEIRRMRNYFVAILSQFCRENVAIVMYNSGERKMKSVQQKKEKGIDKLNFPRPHLGGKMRRFFLCFSGFVFNNSGERKMKSVQQKEEKGIDKLNFPRPHFLPHFLVCVTMIFLSFNCFAQEEHPVPPQSEKISESIVTVGDVAITHQQVYNRLYKLYGEQILSQMMEELLIKTEANSRGMNVKTSEIDEKINVIKSELGTEDNFEKFLNIRKLSRSELEEQIRTGILKEKMVSDDKNIKIDDSNIEDFFEENKEKLSSPEQIKLSHILVQTKSEADDLIIALNAGADFSALCKAKSVDQSTKEKGGELGFFSRGMLIKEIEDIAFGLEEGKICPPIKTGDVWHVIKIEEKKQAIPAKLDKDMKKQIRKSLQQEEINRLYPDWISGLSDKWIKKQR